MKNKHLILLLLLTFLSGGCFPKNHSIVFKEDKLSINYKDLVDSCSLIKELDTKEVSRDMYGDGYLRMKDIEIKCPPLDTTKLGEQILTYTIDEKDFQVTIQVKDMIAPTLYFENRNLDVEQNDVSFNILSLVKAEDNYDSEIFVALASEFDVTVPGLYRVRIKASDSSNNISYDELKILVKESDRVVDKDAEIPKTEIVYVPVQKPNEEPIKKPVDENQQLEGNGNINIPLPESKTFMFSDFTNSSDPYSAAANACASYGEQKFSEGFNGKYNCSYLSDSDTGKYTGYIINFK